MLVNLPRSRMVSGLRSHSGSVATTFVPLRWLNVTLGATGWTPSRSAISTASFTRWMIHVSILYVGFGLRLSCSDRISSLCMFQGSTSEQEKLNLEHHSSTVGIDLLPQFVAWFGFSTQTHTANIKWLTVGLKGFDCYMNSLYLSVMFIWATTPVSDNFHVQYGRRSDQKVLNPYHLVVDKGYLSILPQ